MHSIDVSKNKTTMHSKIEYKLIDGTFTAENARTVLHALVNSKIGYHRLEKFSHEERFGKDIHHSEKRINELVKLYEAIEDAVVYAIKHKKAIRVNGTIELQFVDP